MGKVNQARLEGLLLTDDEISRNAQALAGDSRVAIIASKYGLACALSKFSSVNDRASLVKALTQITEETVHSKAEVRIEGLENLDASKPLLAIGEHHNHVIDVMTLNASFYRANLPRIIAIRGNNLDKNELAHLSFRMVDTIPISRQKSQIISAYRNINALLDSGEWVWVAQSEGLVKQGNNSVHPNILRMIMTTNGFSSVQELTQSVQLVAISNNASHFPGERYRATRDATGVKRASYDALMIKAGFTEPKGVMVQRISEPLDGRGKTIEEINFELNRHIQGNRAIFPQDVAAYNIIRKQIGELQANYDQLSGHGLVAQIITAKNQLIDYRASLQDNRRAHIPARIQMRAVPVINWLIANGLKADEQGHQELLLQSLRYVQPRE